MPITLEQIAKRAAVDQGDTRSTDKDPLAGLTPITPEQVQDMAKKAAEGDTRTTSQIENLSTHGILARSIESSNPSTPEEMEGASIRVNSMLKDEAIKRLGGKITDPAEIKAASAALANLKASVLPDTKLDPQKLSDLEEGAIQQERLNGLAAKKAHQAEEERLKEVRGKEADNLLEKIKLGNFTTQAREAIMSALEAKNFTELPKDEKEAAAFSESNRLLAIHAAIEAYENAAARRHPMREPTSSYEKDLIVKYMLRGENIDDAFSHALRGNLWHGLIPNMLKAIFKNIMKDNLGNPQ